VFKEITEPLNSRKVRQEDRRRDKKYSSGDEKTIAKDEAVRPGESFCILVR
jgi:hypothetical protein